MENFIVLNLGHACTVHKWWNKDLSSPFVRLFFVKSGRAVIHLADSDFELLPGFMYMLPPYTPHAYECDPGFDFYYLFVYLGGQGERSIFDQYAFPFRVHANEASQLLFENYCMLYPQLNLPSRDAEAFLNHQAYRDYAQAYMQMKSYERMQLHGMVEILFSYFVKHSEPKATVSDKRIAAVLDYIQQNADKSITMEELADRACMTKSYMIRAFRLSMGITPLQYIIRRKIQHAQTLLLATEMSVQEITAAVGIDDASYFIRLFKKHLGFTPQEYRQKLIG